ncbi:vacuolar protein-sorting-associated protein 25 isoform X2 [Folsomia candida]|uniref:Vacuolar protein-sorting-associated protein 25 n=1 Tax=Folsomia candida TaxID=158441 RepID=A0A481SWN0_FOLCA|nr:vacuolar protein-sorting-associated protein 25 isoform X2 [Folsomia candida]QBH73043.1 hypothetical protein [Folsomia candida]
MATIAAVEFNSWPAHYNFPPFFTLQPNRETQAKQLSIWIQLIKDYASKTRLFSIDHSHPIFTNTEISRSLTQEGISTIFDEMIRTSQGEYVDASKKDRIFIWWQSKEVWAKVLMQSAEKGGLLNSVATIYELLNDHTPLEGMEEAMLVKVLKVLEASGKCEVMGGAAGGSVEGVKFFM